MFSKYSIIYIFYSYKEGHQSSPSICQNVSLRLNVIKKNKKLFVFKTSGRIWQKHTFCWSKGYCSLWSWLYLVIQGLVSK